MKSDIQISHLKTLIAIHEEGGFSAGARRVGRTQSAVTHQMQNLERIVGTPLFTAKGRQRELTAAGRTLVRHGGEIISLCNYAVSASAKSRQTGIVRIGTPQEVAEEFLPNVLAQLSTQVPEINFVIHADRSPNLMEMLESGQLDLAISTRSSSNYESVLLTKMPVLWIAAPSWRRDPATPWPLVLTDEPSMFRRIALSALDIGGLTYVERATSPSLAGVRLAISAGLGITARTQSAFLAETQVLDEKIGLPSLPDISYYLHRSVQTTNPAIEETFALLVEHAKRIDQRAGSER